MNRKISLQLFSETENIALKKKVENLVSGIKSGKLIEEQERSDQRIKDILNRVLKIHAGRELIIGLLVKDYCSGQDDRCFFAFVVESECE
jgi:hypothetical protein